MIVGAVEGWGVGPVIQPAGDDGAINVAGDEFDADFLPDAWNEMRSPVCSGRWFSDANPGSSCLVAGSIRECWMQELPGDGFVSPLPGELDLDSMIPLGGDF
ncbi:hypothetical protein GCM10027343_42770 [Noviherbaspirillum agri]